MYDPEQSVQRSNNPAKRAKAVMDFTISPETTSCPDPEDEPPVLLEAGADDEVPDADEPPVVVAPADTEAVVVALFELTAKVRIDPISKYAVAKSVVPLLITLSKY